jgi:hypothetical protein
VFARNRASSRASLRIVLLNINKLDGRAHELNWWLQTQIDRGDPVDVLLLTEPVTGPISDLLIHPEYTITAPDVHSPFSSNPHFPTCALTYNRSAVAALSPAPTYDRASVASPPLAGAMPEHRGITYIRVSPLGGDCPVVILMVIYVPNPNAPEDYTRSLYETASKAVCLIREMGAVPLVSMDSNCPFKSPGQFPNSRNARYLSEFLTDSQFLVFNWDPKASGFNTRIRGKEQSQLDLVIGPQSLLRRMTRLTMDSRIHLGSDHCAVDLSIAMKLGHIPVTKGRSYIKYNFSEANISKFVEALTRLLPEWNRSVTNIRLPPVGSVEAKNLVTNRTSNLAQVIVGCAKATCEPKSGVGGTGPQDNKRVSKGVELRVRARDVARDNLQACMLASRRLVGGPTDTNVANARTELARASAALKSELTSPQDESDARAWAKISATFTKNKSEFASAFKKHSLSHG